MTSAPPPVLLTLDPTGADHLVQAHRMLDSGPVVRVQLPNGNGEAIPVWAITRHRLLADLLNDERVSKDYRNWRAYQAGLIGPESPLHGMLVVRNLVTADGATHRRLRAPLIKPLTSHSVNALREQIAHISAGLLDQLPLQAESGVVDLAHFAARLPLEVISLITGVPASKYPTLQHLVTAIFSTTTPPEAAASVQDEIPRFLSEVVAERTGNLGDDLTSNLIRAHREGNLDEEEVAGSLWVMLTAGHETTRGLIINTVRALLAHPDQLALILNGSATWADAIEETLRWAPPITNFMARYPTEDLVIDGVTISQGEGILAPYLCAGHDPDRYGLSAHAFDLTRRRDPQLLSFGAGPHACPGSRLAHLETTIAIREFFSRWPHARLAVGDHELTPVPSVFTHSVQTLPVQLVPAPQEDPA